MRSNQFSQVASAMLAATSEATNTIAAVAPGSITMHHIKTWFAAAQPKS
ncbi:hypothetical protein [Agrobacterium vitis]